MCHPPLSALRLFSHLVEQEKQRFSFPLRRYHSVGPARQTSGGGRRHRPPHFIEKSHYKEKGSNIKAFHKKWGQMHSSWQSELRKLTKLFFFFFYSAIKIDYCTLIEQMSLMAGWAAIRLWRLSLVHSLPMGGCKREKGRGKACGRWWRGTDTRFIFKPRLEDVVGGENWVGTLWDDVCLPLSSRGFWISDNEPGESRCVSTAHTFRNAAGGLVDAESVCWYTVLYQAYNC